MRDAPPASEALGSRNAPVCEKLTSRVNFSKHRTFSRQNRCNENLEFRKKIKLGVRPVFGRAQRQLVALSAIGRAPPNFRSQRTSCLAEINAGTGEDDPKRPIAAH